MAADWLQANRDAYAGWTDRQFRDAFPTFSWTPPPDLPDGWSLQDDAEFLQEQNAYATEHADDIWDESVKEAIAAWQKSGRSLAELPDVAPPTLFIADPRNLHASGLEAADMRSLPQFAAMADRMRKMTNKALENKLKQVFPHYNPSSDANENVLIRTAAIADWRAAKAAARNAQENAHASASTPSSTSSDAQAPVSADDEHLVSRGSAEGPGGNKQDGHGRADDVMELRSAAADAHGFGHGWEPASDEPDEEGPSFRFG